MSNEQLSEREGVLKILDSRYLGYSFADKVLDADSGCEEHELLLHFANGDLLIMDSEWGDFLSCITVRERK